MKSVAEAINLLMGPGAGVIVITHYARILRYLSKIDFVHVMAKGKMIKYGGRPLLKNLSQKVMDG